MKQTYIILFVFLAAVSCKKDIYSGITFTAPIFPDSIAVKAEVLNDTLFTKIIGNIALYKNYIILLTPAEDNMFQLYDKKTGVKIKDFGELGRGPQQILKIYDFSINNQQGTLTAFHQATREIYCFYLDSVIQNRPHFMDKINIKHYEDMTFDNAYRCKQNFLLRGGKCEAYPGGARLSLLSESGEIINMYDQYPVSSNFQDSIHAGEDWRELWCKQSISPDGTKYAEVAGIGGIFETFSIENKIEPLALKGYYKPHFYEKNYKKTFTAKSQFTFYYLTVSNQYVYALSHNGGSEYRLPKNDIQVFDWKGNPIKKYKTDQRLMSICVDETNQKIYAITFNNYEYYLVSFNL